MRAPESEGFHDFGIVLSTQRPLAGLTIEIHTDSDSTTVIKDFNITECVKGNYK